MRYGPLSRKQKTAMLWWCSPGSEDFDAIICDGAIRSGKTLSLTVGFVMWSMTAFDGQIFAMCGKTIESLRRNVTNLMPQWLGGAFEITEKRTEHCLRIRRGEVENTYYLFGGRDESSFAHIQGITLAGALLDEVALMPRSFVEQTIARCSVAGSRLFFSCNPDTPGHWFYQEWIQKAQERNALYLHFTLSDNLALDEKVRERYERMYTGTFYRRYVLGEWVAAQGLVYPFAPEEILGEEDLKEPLSWYISVDYGTRNPCSMGLWAVEERSGRALRVRESYYDSRKTGRQKTDGEYYQDLCAGGSVGPELHHPDPSGGPVFSPEGQQRCAGRDPYRGCVPEERTGEDPSPVREHAAGAGALPLGGGGPGQTRQGAGPRHGRHAVFRDDGPAEIVTKEGRRLGTTIFGSGDRCDAGDGKGHEPVAAVLL